MMALESIPYYNDLFNLMLFDETMNATQCDFNDNFCADDNVGVVVGGGGSGLGSALVPPGQLAGPGKAHPRANCGVQGRKKRKRRTKVACKNKEVAETQRMTHITVERNRRKLMNDHLSVLRSLMPESYAQRGDQASIVGGAIEFVKELEHLVHSLEAQKLQILNQTENLRSGIHDNSSSSSSLNKLIPDPQCHSSQTCNKYTLKRKAEETGIEVTLIETHANIRISSQKTQNQLSKLVSGLQTLGLIVLHLSVTSLDPLVLYSISAKVEEGCQLTSVDGIAEAVHHMLRIIEEDACPSLANILST